MSVCSVNISPTEYRQRHSPRSSYLLFKCPKFCKEEDLRIEITKENVLLQMKCNICQSCWYVCYNCGLQKKHFQTTIQFHRHRHRCIINSRDNINDNKSIHRKVRRVESPKINPCLQFDYFNKLSLFGRKENKLFYFYEQFNQGVHYLIGLS